MKRRLGNQSGISEVTEERRTESTSSSYQIPLLSAAVSIDVPTTNNNSGVTFLFEASPVADGKKVDHCTKRDVYTKGGTSGHTERS